MSVGLTTRRRQHETARFEIEAHLCKQRFSRILASLASFKRSTVLTLDMPFIPLHCPFESRAQTADRSVSILAYCDHIYLRGCQTTTSFIGLSIHSAERSGSSSFFLDVQAVMLSAGYVKPLWLIRRHRCMKRCPTPGAALRKVVPSVFLTAARPTWFQ